MKRVVSVLLLVCMLVSLMGMGTAAYAEELADGAAVVEQTGDAPAAEQEPTGDDAEPETPTTPEQTQPTEAPSTEGDGQNGTQEPEATPAPEVTARPAADEGFFAALTDAELSALTAELARLGYNVTDRAGLYALAVQLGIGDLENFYIWLDNELYILESAKVEANGKLYESLDEVVALLANDSARAVTAKLLDNAAVYGLEIPAAHELTLDLNGFALVLEMQEGETAPAPVTVTDKMEKDENGDPVYSYAALTLKNGTVSAGDPNALAIYDAGRLTLANVNVAGGIHVAESYERLTTLSIEPGDAFKTGFVNGAITADAGMENAIRITGGDFITDVSAYIDASVYECTLGDNGLYTVARIKGADITSYTGDDAADAANGAVVKVQSLKITAEPNAELDTAADAALDNASVKLAGLESALKETSLAEIIAAYEAAAPAQTQQARGMSRAVVIAAGDENADNAGNAADTSAVADGTELQLKVKAVLAAAVEGSSVSYEVKPYAVINGVEVPVKNEWLNGQAMLLSLYTGFLPKTVEHVHDDGTVETIDLNNCTYNNANGVLTMNVSEFSEFKVQAAVNSENAFTDAINTAADGGEITLDGDVSLTKTIDINKNLTVNLNGKTLSMTGTATDSVMFNITNGVTLTIKGGGIGGTLESSGYIAAVESGCTLVLGDEYTANMTNATFNATAPMQPAAVGQTTGNVKILCAVTSFNPSSYVTHPYAATQNNNNTWTVDEYAAMLTKRSTISGSTTEYYKTLALALGNVTATASTTQAEIDTITLLKDITEEVTIDKSIIIYGGGYKITGNVSLTKGTANNTLVWLENVAEITGNLTATNAWLNMKNTSGYTKIGGSVNAKNVPQLLSSFSVSNVDVAGSISFDSSTNSFAVSSSKVAGDVSITKTAKELSLTTVDITGTLTVGAGASLNFRTGTAASITAQTDTASTSNTDVKLNSVKVASNIGSDSEALGVITVGMCRNVNCDAVTAASLTIADSPEGSTIANNPTAVIKDSDIDSVTTGARMLKAGLNGLRASTAIVGKETSSVEIKSLSAASNIGTLTIGDNCGTTTIEGNLNGKNTTIGTLTVGTGTNPTLGANTSSNATNDQKLVITTINSQGRTTIESGKYETLNGDGTKNTFVLYGGNYQTDYSQYCACDQDSNTGYYDHYVCKYQTAEGRYRIEQLTPKVLSVTPSTVVRGTKTPVQIVVNVPYTHACNNDTLTVTGVNNNSGTMAQSLNYGTDYTVTQETSKDAAGNDVPTGNSVITISGDYVAANTYQSYFVDTQMGKVSATASVRTTLATANRRSGIIRTGDDSNIGLLIGIMVLALAVAVTVVVILKKKKSQTDANDVTNKTKPKEPKE